MRRPTLLTSFLRTYACALIALLAFVTVHSNLLFADDKPAPLAITHMLDDQRLEAALIGLANGRLQLATSPAREIPLDELQRIEFPGAKDSAAKPDADAAAVIVYLEGRDSLRGKLVDLSEETVTVAALGVDIKIPLLEVLGLWFPAQATADARAKFDLQLGRPGAEDFGLILGRDRSLAEIQGSARGLKDGKLQMVVEGEARAVNLNRLLGLVFTGRPPLRSAAKMRQAFRLASGDVLSGDWTGMTADAFQLETGWRASINLPRAQVAEISFLNGKLMYLSDLAPSSVEETPYFNRRMPFRRNQSLDGGELKMKQQKFAKGLAVHSRAALGYALDGQFETFEAAVGFDDSAAGKGRVACRVLGDGKELFSQPDLRADQEPTPIKISIAGVQQIILEIDFGAAEDTLDRVIWGNARVTRVAAK